VYDVYKTNSMYELSASPGLPSHLHSVLMTRAFKTHLPTQGQL